MVRRFRLGRLAQGAILVAYGALVPLSITENTSAHKTVVSGVWENSVRNGRLDFIDRTAFDYETNEAKYQWRQAGPIAISETTDTGVAEIIVSDADSCNLAWIGKYDWDADKIRYNTCAMNWSGGYYPGTGQYLYATPGSRRNRTAVHEFGHALGLDHNSLGDCSSILYTPLDFDQPACWVPKTHDVNDINNYWP